jgi:hypothetical protein
MKTGSSRAPPVLRGAQLIPRVRPVDKDGATLFEKECSSTVGGGFQWKGQAAPTRGKPLGPFGRVAEFKRLAQESNKRQHEIMVENEKTMALIISGRAGGASHLP